MAKKIKKQFWKTIPYFMIFSLVLSSIIGGIVFNFDFEIEKISKNDYSIEINKPTVQAQDLASTTVTVQNAAPIFNGYPVETNISTSSSPINVGGNIGFQATGDDPESNNYYLIICSTDAVTASTTGGAPTCVVDTFCVSTSTVDNTPASCTYTGIADPGSEIDEWYAFICDDHGSEAECIESSSQGENPGVAASSSPFYVNHAPSIISVGTSINNQDPGGTFEFTATSTDSDVADVDDVLTMNVCSSNAWTLSGGCASTTFCTATATDIISCQWTDSAPTPDADYDYYVFINDHHDMVAGNNGTSSTYTINNVAPVVNGVYLNSGVAISLNLRGAQLH